VREHRALPASGWALRHPQPESRPGFSLGAVVSPVRLRDDHGGEWREGTPITWTFYLEDGPFSIENYHLEVVTHEEALRSAGFRQIRWHPPQLSPEGEAAFGRAFWNTLLDHSPITFLECTK